MEMSESILTSIKKLLGIQEECEEFDADILMHINSAIFTLRQIGVGPDSIYTVYDKSQTYDDYLGEGKPEQAQVKTYLYYKVRVGWDPPSSSFAIDSLEKKIQEAEWRLKTEIEVFRELSDSGGGEDSK